MRLCYRQGGEDVLYQFHRAREVCACAARGYNRCIMAEWITTKQAAELSGYHPVHLLRLLRAGNIKARKFGIVWQVERASLQAYIRAAEKSEDKRRGARKERR